ncbi:MAG: aminotransferase class I/II-fold pyridoxal phosphate-dependent enzyme [Cyanobacteria bacterium REEB67]|nr:aminotransferase class I/II-fold pyridoxal phosphate-dependent enzyme [Cyanobacteria bacterium REEB67]
MPSKAEILSACGRVADIRAAGESETAGSSLDNAGCFDSLNAHLGALLAALENGKTERSAIKLLHELAGDLAEGHYSGLMLKRVELPTLSRPIELFLTPAVFSPELWGRTFAEGLLKSKEQFHGKKIVEVGTGSGWISILLLLVTDVREILGLDLNPVACLLARLNTWLNGTTEDGEYILTKAGEPIVKAFRVETSDLLGCVLERGEMFDHIVGCIPQVLHPNPVPDQESTTGGEPRSAKELYDLSNYCFEQGILEDRFGLPLIARALEQSQLCLNAGGRVTLVLGGRPGRQAIEGMFDRRGYDCQLVWMRRIQQADDTDLASLVELEREHGIRFHFFMARDSAESVAAETAVKLLQNGRTIYHDLLVYQAVTRFEPEVFSFVRNLTSMHLNSFRKELDFSRLGDERVSFLSRLSQSMLLAKTIPYPHERGDRPLRQLIADYLKSFCYYPATVERIFVGPNRAELASLIFKMTAESGDRLLLSDSLLSVYGQAARASSLDVVVGNDDLSELSALDDLMAPRLIFIAPRQLNNPSPIYLQAIIKQAEAHPERIYVIDDSENFLISSELGSNMTLRLAGSDPLPPNMVFLYGLIKNRISRDLELSFLVNAPAAWMEGLEIGAELSYSRICHSTQLLYQWLFEDLMTFPFPEVVHLPGRLTGNAGETGEGGRAILPPLSSLTKKLARHPVFAPKPVDPEASGMIRLDYGEFETAVPDILVKGLFKGFLVEGESEAQADQLPHIVAERVCAYLRHTRHVQIERQRVVLGQGVFPLFGALIQAFKVKLGRAPLVAVPDGSYGPLYPMLEYYGAEILPVKTSAERAFVLSTKDLVFSRKPDLLWLTQPNNPSGIFMDSERLRSVLELCHRQNIYVFADEIFFLLSDHRLGKWTPASLSVGSHMGGPFADKLFVADGISKSFAAGGLRLGFVVTPDEEWSRLMARTISAPPTAYLRAWDALYSSFLQKAPHNMMDLSQSFSEVESYLMDRRKELGAKRESLTNLLSQYGLSDGVDTPYRGGLFLLARLGDKHEQLAREAQLLTNPSDWGRTKDMVRMCFCLTDQRFDEAMRRLREFLAGQK